MLKKKVLGVIPARYDSSRFPGKPLALIQQKTLIQRTYENALKCSLIDTLIVATDDQRIYDHVVSFGGRVVMTSKDHVNGTERISEVLKQNDEFNNFQFIVNIQGDEPCIEIEVIEKVILALNDKDSPLMSTAVTKLVSEEEAMSPSVVKCVFDQNRNALYFSRALIPSSKTHKFNKETDYYKHIGIYGFRREFLFKYIELNKTPLQISEDLEQLKVIENGVHIRLAIVKSVSIGVDTPDDINKVETLLCKQNSYSSQAESVRP